MVLSGHRSQISTQIENCSSMQRPVQACRDKYSQFVLSLCFAELYHLCRLQRTAADPDLKKRIFIVASETSLRCTRTEVSPARGQRFPGQWPWAVVRETPGSGPGDAGQWSWAVVRETPNIPLGSGLGDLGSGLGSGPGDLGSGLGSGPGDPEHSPNIPRILPEK
jgi:hypothetical protein